MGGVKPDTTLFEKIAGEWNLLVSPIWGLGILVTLFFFGRGLLAMGRAKESANPLERREAVKEAAMAGGGFAGLIGLGSILQIYWGIFF